MKYSVHIDIRKPLEEVYARFTDPANYSSWMDGLIRIEPLEGTPGKPGSTSRFVFKSGARTMEMTETILSVDKPYSVTVRFNANGVENIVTTRLERISPDITRCHNDQDFRFRGIMALVSRLMPGAFKKQSLKYLEAFKAFAERT